MSLDLPRGLSSCLSWQKCWLAWSTTALWQLQQKLFSTKEQSGWKILNCVSYLVGLSGLPFSILAVEADKMERWKNNDGMEIMMQLLRWKVVRRIEWQHSLESMGCSFGWATKYKKKIYKKMVDIVLILRPTKKTTTRAKLFYLLWPHHLASSRDILWKFYEKKGTIWTFTLIQQHISSIFYNNLDPFARINSSRKYQCQSLRIKRLSKPLAY